MSRSAGTLAILTLVVGLVVGTAVGWFLADQPQPAADGPSAPAPPSSDRAAPAGSPAAPAPAESRSASAGSRTRDPAADTNATRDAAGGTRGARADAATGTARITGRVTAPDGAGVPGVLVRAEPRDDDEDDDDESDDVAAGARQPGAPPAVDVEEEIRRFAERRRRAVAATREATTGPDGAYELTGLAGSAFHLEAWRAGWRVERTGRQTWRPVRAGATCDFRAAPICTVRVAVQMPDGRPAGNALVSWTPAETGAGTGGSQQWRASKPEIEVAPGTYAFTAVADAPEVDASGATDIEYEVRSMTREHFGTRDGEAETAYRSAPVTVTVAAAATGDVTLRLAGQPGVVVRVEFPPGERPRAFRIAAMKIDGTAAADPARLLGDAKVRARWVTSGSQGTLPGLASGPWLVGVTLRGGKVAASTSVTVGSEPVTVPLTVPPGDWRDWVKVWVRSPDGKPVRDAELECGCRGSEGSGDNEISAEPEADGSYRVEHYERDAPSLGSSSSFSGMALGDGERTWFVRAESPRWGKVEAEYDPAADREVTLQFFEPAVVRVTVAAFVGNADANRAVLALESRDGTGARRRSDDEEAEIDATGHATFPPVRPGAYDVVLRLAASDSMMDRMNARWRGAEAARVAVRAAAGTNDVTVTLQPLSELVVTFEGDSPAIERVGADGRVSSVRWTPRAASDGRLTISDLAPGRYRLSARRRGEMFVDVPAAGPVAFRPRPYDCLHLEVSEGSYLVELGLRTGDLVVAIEGVEFRSSDDIDAAMAGAKTRERSRFTIQRGGHRFDVTADGKRFEEDDKSLYRHWAR